MSAQSKISKVSFEDITEPVSNLPIVVQRFIELYAQNAGWDRNVKYIGKHSSELV